MNVLHERVALVLGVVGQRAEGLDGDGTLEDEVLGPVDDREAALADDALDLVLVVDLRADEAERVFDLGHGVSCSEARLK